ncbi:MAG: MFS transporter [Bacteroidaceae bacterium]|nr:MFS transporter [Bacteroidaceae bacterium]MBQ2978718.1 MFS transporter [Bacteroidaceae bacterium]
MKIETGRGRIPLITLLGIWSISALNALPGLAVSPILGDLSKIFPHSTELDIQMLTSLPSLMIIPFVLLSGKLTERIDNIRLLQVGLVIFVLSGVLYLLSNQMWQLIAISALLGIGSGLIIPLSTGLIGRFFVGRFRTMQFGLSSAITNLTLVVATIITGYLAEIEWHLPFIVYLLPIVSIALSFQLRKALSQEPEPSTVVDNSNNGLRRNVSVGNNGIGTHHLMQVMLFYGLVTYLVVIVSLNLPFLIEERGMRSSLSGTYISLFFLAIMAPGFVLNKFIDIMGRSTQLWSLLMIVLGLGLIMVTSNEWLVGIGCVVSGAGYGIIQPIMYDRTTHIALPERSTLALACVMAMNYVAILVCPFVIKLFKIILHDNSELFAFQLNTFLAAVTFLVAFIYRKAALFDN